MAELTLDKVLASNEICKVLQNFWMEMGGIMVREGKGKRRSSFIHCFWSTACWTDLALKCCANPYNFINVCCVIFLADAK